MGVRTELSTARSRRRLSTVVAAGVIAGAAALSGCSTSAGNAVDAGPPAAPSAAVSSAAGSSPAPASSVPAPPSTPLPLTVTSTVPGVAVTAVPPPATPEPPPTDGPCPYLADDVVADINGQRTGTTQVIDVQPYPVCIFSRSDGGWLASVRIISADTPQAAVAAVDDHVPIERSDPANQPPGWTGGAMVTDAGSVYAVSKGPLAIVAESNQQQSIKGRQLVITAVGNLGL